MANSLETHTHCHHHFEWGVIFAGTAVATAISIIFVQFGSIIGLSSDTALAGAADLTHWTVIAIGLWLMATQLTAAAVGGYMAGRLRMKTLDLTPHDNEVKDGFYGLTVWAASTIVVFAALSYAATVVVAADAATTPVVDITPELADKEQNAAIIFAFILGSTSLVSAALSWAASTLGGDHRDTGKDFAHCLSFKCK
jgi:hypothetical protein